MCVCQSDHDNYVCLPAAKSPPPVPPNKPKPVNGEQLTKALAQVDQLKSQLAESVTRERKAVSEKQKMQLNQSQGAASDEGIPQAQIDA